MIALADTFLDRPFAHRGLHDETMPENSWPAFEAAVEHGYGIELDVQISSDGEAIVFHDEKLDRMTTETGLISDRSTSELEQIDLAGAGTGIYSLQKILDRIGSDTPVLVEVKDQHGELGVVDGRLEASVAKVCTGRSNIAVMSFNPDSVAKLQTLLPDTPRGLTTAAFDFEGWPYIPEATCLRLREIPDYERVQASFISHEAEDLGRKRVAQLKRDGAMVFCWTIRSPTEEKAARAVANNITFEGYLAASPSS